MPMYVYQCDICGSRQEVLHGITEERRRILHCDECGEDTPVTKVVAAMGAPQSQARRAPM